MSDIPTFGIVRENEERRDGGCAIVFDPETGLLGVGLHPAKGYHSLFGGGFDEGEGAEEGVLRELKEESGLCNYSHVEKLGEANAHYFNRVKKVNRVAHTTCFLVVLENTVTEGLSLEEHEEFTLVYVTPEELLENWKEHNENKDLDHWLYYLGLAVKKLQELGYQK